MYRNPELGSGQIQDTGYADSSQAECGGLSRRRRAGSDQECPDRPGTDRAFLSPLGDFHRSANAGVVSAEVNSITATERIPQAPFRERQFLSHHDPRLTAPLALDVHEVT